MLNSMYPLLQLVQALALPELHLLRNNRVPSIHLSNDLMDHDAGTLQPLVTPRLPRPLNRTRTRKLARQCGVQVDDLDPRCCNRVQKLRRHNVHPARAHDQRRPRRQPQDNGCQRAVVRGARRCGALGRRRLRFLVRD
jgi:hypothetical protein